jgi:hypothetical protein
MRVGHSSEKAQRMQSLEGPLGSLAPEGQVQRRCKGLQGPLSSWEEKGLPYSSKGPRCHLPGRTRRQGSHADLSGDNNTCDSSPWLLARPQEGTAVHALLWNASWPLCGCGMQDPRLSVWLCFPLVVNQQILSALRDGAGCGGSGSTSLLTSENWKPHPGPQDFPEANTLLHQLL